MRPRLLFASGSALVAVVVAAAVFAFLWPSESRSFNLGTLDQFAPGTVTTYNLRGGVPVLSPDGHVQTNAAFHVVRLEDGEIRALSSKDPHLGCAVPWRPDFERDGETGFFRNPCHGETYDMAGNRVFGPSPRDLDRFGRFGREAWYGFSFRVDGYVDPNDSNRLVIGQWKEQSGGSPFVAQRFDNRIFRITVQDNECRAVIAEMPSDLGLMHGLLYLTSHKMKCTRAPDIRLTPPNPALHILPDPYGAWVDMVYRIRGGRDGDGLVEVWANGECVVQAEGAIGNRDFGGPNQYFKFGVYRDKVDYLTRIRIDRFRRAASHREVDPDFSSCPWWGG